MSHELKVISSSETFSQVVSYNLRFKHVFFRLVKMITNFWQLLRAKDKTARDSFFRKTTTKTDLIAIHGVI